MSRRWSNLHSWIGVVLLVGAITAPAIAQDPSVHLTVDDIKQTENGFLVTGTVGCSGPESGGGASHSYSVRVIAEIMETDDAQYPQLAEYLVIRTPAGAQTSYMSGSGAGGTMTREEYYGVGIATVRLGGIGGLGETEFSGTIPKEYAEKPMRIRAELDYQFNHVNAAWPSIRYYHAEGRSGIVPTFVEGGVPEDQTPTDDASGSSKDPKGKASSDPSTADTPDFTWSTDTNKPKPYNIPPDIGLDPVNDPKLGSSTPVGGTEADSVGVDTGAPKKSDNQKIDEVIENAMAQIASGKLNDEQKQQLIKHVNETIIEQGNMNAQQVWDDYYVDSALGVSDTMLTYNPVTGLYYTGGKVFTGVVNGDWTTTDGQANIALNALTMIPIVKVPKAGLVPVGTVIQAGSDYYKTGHAFVTKLDWNDGPGVVDGSGVYTNWGTYSNMGTKSTPGTPEPVIDGVER
jgi:type II secretory pathway pseudopilin PulG